MHVCTVYLIQSQNTPDVENEAFHETGRELEIKLGSEQSQRDYYSTLFCYFSSELRRFKYLPFCINTNKVYSFSNFITAITNSKIGGYVFTFTTTRRKLT